MFGNVMIDTLVKLLPKAEIKEFRDLGIQPLVGKGKSYALMTLHRPSNVDNQDILGRIMGALEDISNDLPVIFPIHPRTRQRLIESGFKVRNSKLHFIDPVGYLDFLSLQKNATVVITDSGGIQEQTTFLGIPCLTMRKNTERPITVEIGTNIVIGQDMERLKKEVYQIMGGKVKKGKVPPLWDGGASERIAEVIFSNSLKP